MPVIDNKGIENDRLSKETVLNISGYRYEEMKALSEFPTEYLYNNREWKYGPWSFSYMFDENSEDLICELYHRMTNHRVYGWRSDGTKISETECERVFPDED